MKTPTQEELEDNFFELRENIIKQLQTVLSRPISPFQRRQYSDVAMTLNFGETAVVVKLYADGAWAVGNAKMITVKEKELRWILSELAYQADREFQHKCRATFQEYWGLKNNRPKFVDCINQNDRFLDDYLKNYGVPILRGLVSAMQKNYEALSG